MLAEQAVLTVGKRLERAAGRVDPVVAALPRAAAPARPALLRVLGGFGGPEALAAVRPRLADADPAVREAALLAVANWPDLSAAAELLEDRPGLPEHGPPQSGRARLSAADGPGEGRRRAAETARAGPARSPRPWKPNACCWGAWPMRRTPGALHVAAAMLDDAEVRAEAEAATLKIARGLVRLDCARRAGGNEEAGRHDQG